MNKQEFLSQGVDDLRTALLGMFDDPDGELAEMTKQPLIKFARENWSDIAPNLEQPETAEEIASAVLPPEDVETEEVEESPLDLEPEPTVDESVATPERYEDDSWEGNPGTNLHGGVPGHPVQKVGTRNLA